MKQIELLAEQNFGLVKKCLIGNILVHKGLRTVEPFAACV